MFAHSSSRTTARLEVGKAEIHAELRPTVIVSIPQAVRTSWLKRLIVHWWKSPIYFLVSFKWVDSLVYLEFFQWGWKHFFLLWPFTSARALNLFSCNFRASFFFPARYHDALSWASVSHSACSMLKAFKDTLSVSLKRFICPPRARFSSFP